MTASVRSVAKAAALLQAFNREHQVLTVRELAAATGIPRSTCHALCQTLVETGLLEIHDVEGYQLGRSLAMLGGQVIERTGLIDAAVGPASTILANTRTEIHVAQYVPTGIVYLLRLQNGRRLPNQNKTGRHWPLHTSACGMAVYAALPEAAREKHARDLPEQSLTALTDASRDFLRHGYVISNISQEGFRSVGAPILDQHGEVVGAIGTGDARTLMTPARTHEIGLAVRRTAEAISRGLGFLPSFTPGGRRG
ncbi:IclR family transcriptional regulator [Georgenia sp. EYE_87]|uniref:IclR family transcriptional regulator n=1 Tax=Georgenia sp. EYE_87 TaxID=2853448 RepID=UPI002005984B|nr:IclR family transcriptional regulator [Georgenia sp. EYE_87]MCK6210767.1 IclR family transcriptional regulator [Georgenia sp. EYE_87]